MPENKPHNADSAAKMVRKLTLPDGFRVGIVNLDNILKEVSDMKLSDTRIIKQELLNRVEAQNYVPSTVKTDYSLALFREYQRKFEPDKFKEEKTERHQHTKG